MRPVCHVPAGAQQLGIYLLQLAMRAHHQPVDPGVDRQRRRCRRPADARGVASFIRWRASMRAAWISARQPPPARRPTVPLSHRLADRQAADVDPVDLLVVAGELGAEPAVEPGGADARSCGCGRSDRCRDPARSWRCPAVPAASSSRPPGSPGWRRAGRARAVASPAICSSSPDRSRRGRSGR